MDDGDFDDLLAGVDDVTDSSQQSLTNAAANLDIDIAGSISSVCTGTHASQGNQLQHSLPHDGAHGSTPLFVATQIERTFSDVAEALTAPDGQLSLTLKAKPTKPGAESRSRQISFPGKTEEEAWRFTVILRLMELIHEAIRSDVVLSKRDLYYRDPALFGNQSVVDRYVDSIAYTLHVPRAMLNVTAAAKGLVAGAFRICRRDGSVVDAASDNGGILVPTLKDVPSIDMSAVRWILVIEKEASFRSIAASALWDRISTCGVIMTAKGYPDIATRAMLRFMTTASPQNGFASPPAFCLVDFDPDGLAIMSTYRNGSMALEHENEDLRVPQLQWLGLREEELAKGANQLHGEQGLLSLTNRDRRKAVCMLERNDPDAVDPFEIELRKALQTMLMLNTKAELQLLDATPRGMADLLTAVLCGFE